MSELCFENVSRVPLIGMACFALPVFILLVWIFLPMGWAMHPLFIGLFLLALAGLVQSLWVLYSQIPKRPVLATCDQGIFMGLWVRRGIPWDNVRDIRLTEMRLTGGLKKRWSRGRPYDQELVVDLNSSGDLLFEDAMHRLAHCFTIRKDCISLRMRLVSTESNDAVLDAVRSRWLQAHEETAGE